LRRRLPVIETTARIKLADRNITWQEKYTERTELLKKQYGDVVGPGSYYRFEGRDADTGDEYFIVVSPAKIKDPEEQFFAGVRKLPADFAAGGQYFDTMYEALEYAHDTWGIALPKGARDYTTKDLRGIKDKIDDWKEDETPDKEASSFRFVRTASYPFYRKVPAISVEATTRRNIRTGYMWFDPDAIAAGSDPDFEREKETMPALEAAGQATLKERASRRSQIAKWYGPQYTEAEFYRVWLSYKPDEGMYIISISPYLGTYFDQAIDKFGMFVKKLNLASQEEIDTKVNQMLQDYAEKWGVNLTASDLNIPEGQERMGGAVTLNSQGRQKLYNSEEWKTRILDYYGVQPGRGMEKNLREAYKTRKEAWKSQLDAAYRRSQEEGRAFEEQQPPPPSVSLTKHTIGQQVFTTIYRDKPETAEAPEVTEGSEVVKYGFDSIKEAAEYLEANVWEGIPLGDVPDTTAEDLKEAREAEQRRVSKLKGGKEGETPAEQISVPSRKTPVPSRPAPPPQTTKVPVKEKAKEPPKAAPKEVAKPVEKKPAPKPVKEVQKAPAAKPVFHPVEEWDIDTDVESAVRNTVRNLVKLSSKLDREGKGDEAEEINAILRKHVLSPKTSATEEDAEDIPHGSDWVERHSVNCYFCGKLGDEREWMPADVYNGGDGGSICSDCQKKQPKAPISQEEP
jgi:hypothetical protein